MLADLNWLGLLGAFIANMAVGAIYYSPLVAGNAWLASTGRTQDDIDGGGAAMATVAVPAIMNATGLMLIAHLLNIDTALNGLLLGFLVWLCFVLPTNWIEVLFDRKSYRTMALNNGNFILSFSLMGLIIGAFG